MAPNFRQNTQTRRSNRSGYVEHDDFDGLPTRQWQQEWVNITPPPPPDPTRKSDIWAVELPHGMPKDAPMMPNHTQELLRAARSGRLYKRPAPTEEEEAEAEPTVVEKVEKKEEDLSTKGFRIKIWKQVPRNAEGPTISYLAKRRKGTVTLSSDLPAGAAPGPTITKATVRRIDAAGNPYTQEVILTEGQQVDGDVISTTVVAAPVPTVNADVSVTPVRRRPPPPKRKPKGPGRGRKKKLPLPLNSHSSAANAAATGLLPGAQANGAQGVQPADGESKHNEQNDVEMVDDDEGDDGEDGEDDGEEGDDDDEDGEAGDGDTGFISRADSETKSDVMDITPSQPQDGDPATSMQPPSQELPSRNTNLSTPLPPPSHLEGSPLKHVISAQSPVHADPPSQESLPKLEASPDQTEQTTQPVEPASSLLPAVNSSIPAESSGVNITPEANALTETDIDVNMQDAGPAVIGIPAETIPLPAVDDLVSLSTIHEPPSVPTIEPGLPSPIKFPVDDGAQGGAGNVEPTLEATGIAEAGAASTDGKDPESTADVNPQVDPPIQGPSDLPVEISTVQAVDGPSTDGQPVPAFGAGAAELRDEQPLPLIPDEIAANSPDLFSGLEAALNQHGHSNNEPIPEVPEGQAPQPEASSESNP